MAGLRGRTLMQVDRARNLINTTISMKRESGRHGVNLMGLQAESASLSPAVSVAAFAWGNLRNKSDHPAGTFFFDCLKVSGASKNGGLIRALLFTGSDVGLPYRVQIRIGHRPEARSKVRLYKGLFGDIGRRSGALTAEHATSLGLVALIGLWELNNEAIDVASTGCFDQSICCFVCSATPVSASDVLEQLAVSLVTNGTCQINYPDFAREVCLQGMIIVRAAPVQQHDVLLLGESGTEPLMWKWVQEASTYIK